MHGLKSVILAILPRIGQSAVSPALHFHPKKMAGNGCISFYQSNMNKITIRSYAWSFAIQIQIQAVWGLWITWGLVCQQCTAVIYNFKELVRLRMPNIGFSQHILNEFGIYTSIPDKKCFKSSFVQCGT